MQEDKKIERRVQPEQDLGVTACQELASKVRSHVLLTGFTSPQATSNMWLSLTGIHEVYNTA